MSLLRHAQLLGLIGRAELAGRDDKRFEHGQIGGHCLEDPRNRQAMSAKPIASNIFYPSAFRIRSGTDSIMAV